MHDLYRLMPLLLFLGAAYCQLMDLLVPGCIDLQHVKFKAKNKADVLNNYKLLKGALNKTSTNKVSFKHDCCSFIDFIYTRSLCYVFRTTSGRDCFGPNNRLVLNMQ